MIHSTYGTIVHVCLTIHAIGQSIGNELSPKKVFTAITLFSFMICVTLFISASEYHACNSNYIESIYSYYIHMHS